MKYLRTNLATDWKKEKNSSVRVFEKLLWFIPKSNPGYEGKLHLVNEWLVEFGDDNLPAREIGLNKNGVPILAGPSKGSYGFWLDTNMTFQDFDDQEIEADEFEKLWAQFIAQ